MVCLDLGLGATGLTDPGQAQWSSGKGVLSPNPGRALPFLSFPLRHLHQTSETEKFQGSK